MCEQVLALAYSANPDFEFSSKDLLQHLLRAVSSVFCTVLSYLGGRDLVAISETCPTLANALKVCTPP